MRAFIVRPFGTKNDIDFDRVERELIAPALDAAGVAGRTTAEILKQGNIRVDMFQRLLTADLVVADVSIHNANVFYELGIRHALRGKRTFLLRCDGDKYPFDLQTDRYFVYRKDEPAASLGELTEALHHTLASDDQDSPVFRSLPHLRQQNRSAFLVVPRDFREEVERARREKQPGDLELLAHEARGFEWECEGLRLVGRAQFALEAMRGALATWEALRRLDADDVEANLRLATIHERLGDLVEADLAIQRVLDQAEAGPKDRAEALSLAARNAKRRWQSDWEELPEERRREEALRSPHLETSLDAYAKAFREDLNAFYPGLNAVAMLRVLTELAAAQPEVWAERFDEPEQGAPQLAARQRQAAELAAAVRTSLAAERVRLERKSERDVWVDLSAADLALLTSDRPQRVADAYRKALADAPALAQEAARKQIALYARLGVMAANVTAALAAFPPPRPLAVHRQKGRILLFTGHMIDARNRKEPPRFPATKEAEDAAREAIREAVERERALAPIACGIAGGSSGGDILFHEVCADLGISTRLFLALPKAQYLVESVQAAGPEWVERFSSLYKGQPEVRELAAEKELPNWLVERRDEYTIWQRNNLWLLYNALAERDEDVVLIALWNGKTGDGPGGTADLVQQASARGAKVVVLDSDELFGLNP
jgi:tetratricopeptide repeat protein